MGFVVKMLWKCYGHTISQFFFSFTFKKERIMLEIQTILQKKITDCWCGKWLLINEKSDINGESRWKLIRGLPH